MAKYIVAERVSLCVKGSIIGAGKEIPDGMLDEATVKNLAAAKKIVEAGAKEKAEKPAASEAASEKKADDAKADEAKGKGKK